MPNFLLTMSMLSVAAGAGLRFEAMPEATEQCIGDGDACQEIGTSQCCPGLICLQFLNLEMACVTPPDSGAAAAGRAAACALECIADPESDKCQECYHKASAAAEAAAPCSGDEAILSTTKFLCDAVSCAKKNFLGIAGTVKCMEAADKVSESCATCFTKVTKCIATHCALKCIADPESDKCLECGHKACDAIAKTCVPAGTSLPPNPKNCKSASLAVAATLQCGGYHAICDSDAPCCAPFECAGWAGGVTVCTGTTTAAAPAEAKATADATPTVPKSVSLAVAAEAEIVEVAEDPCAPGMPYRCGPTCFVTNCSEQCSWYGNDGCNADCSCKTTPLWMRLGNVLTTLV